MPIANYSTTIAVEKSIAEVQAILGKHGARGVLVEYDEHHQPKQLRFSVAVKNGEKVYFTLPARAERILALLKRQGVPRRLQTEDQARRVAWRLIKDWVRAQVALIEAELVEMTEVFLPYMTNTQGDTMFEVIKRQRFALPEGQRRSNEQAGDEPLGNYESLRLR